MDWIFSSEFLMSSPSRNDGISFELERGYRSKTAWFIEGLGKELKFNRFVVSTAQVLSHRFFVYQSFKQHDRFIISVASLFLAAKVEESMIKYKHLQTTVKAYIHYRKKSTANFDADPKEIETKVLVAERILLQTLCFDVQVTHPYVDAMKKIRILKPYIPQETQKEFHQVAVNIINDSYRTTLCLQYPPEQIGIGAIFTAAMYMGLQPLTIRNRESTWYELLETDIDENSLKNICEQLMDAYAEASSNQPLAVDPKKIIHARLDLQRLLLQQPKSDSQSDFDQFSSSQQASPNSITYPPPTVPHQSGSEDQDAPPPIEIDENIKDFSDSSSSKKRKVQSTEYSDYPSKMTVSSSLSQITDKDLPPPPPPPPMDDDYENTGSIVKDINVTSSHDKSNYPVYHDFAHHSNNIIPLPPPVSLVSSVNISNSNFLPSYETNERGNGNEPFSVISFPYQKKISHDTPPPPPPDTPQSYAMRESNFITDSLQSSSLPPLPPLEINL
jgi:hypothetical protein